MTTPEQPARKNIDDLLTAAGWQVQSRDEMNLGAARGVAVREFPLRTGYADYLLFADRRAIGAVEAKKEGTPLVGVEAQSAKYGEGLPDIPPAWRKPLAFLYESTGVAQSQRVCVPQAGDAGGMGGGRGDRSRADRNQGDRKGRPYGRGRACPCPIQGHLPNVARSIAPDAAPHHRQPVTRAD